MTARVEVAAARTGPGNMRAVLLFAAVAGLFVVTGFVQSWNVTLTILNMGLISAIMALGVNMQWGYAGLFNVGVVGFVALGGLACVLIAHPTVTDAWAAGGPGVLAGLALGAATLIGALLAWARLPKGRMRSVVTVAIVVVGYWAYRQVLDPAAARVEAVNPAGTGFLGGLGLPVILAWPAGALMAAGAAWAIAKTALGLRSDYLAIATLGIAEIIIAVIKSEDWMTRGVKNVTGIPRPVPYEVDMLADPGFVAWAVRNGFEPATAASIIVKLCYAGLFAAVLVALVILMELALKSPWGRMMRAIRDNEVAAEAMGKDVKARHLQTFVLGSAVIGMAGAMMTTLDSQLTPGTYQPLRFTFLVWVMVIVGGSGNNWGAVLGGFLIWWLWVMVEPIGLWVMNVVTMGMPDGALKKQLIDAAAHMRLLVMGVVLLFVLRFSPRGLLPEK